jgi:hypothetical protein
MIKIEVCALIIAIALIAEGFIAGILKDMAYYKGTDKGWRMGYDAGKAWAIEHIKPMPETDEIYLLIGPDNRDSLEDIASRLTKAGKRIKKSL